MNHVVYRNLRSRDTLFGLELFDLLFMGGIVNVLYLVHPASTKAATLLNIAILIGSYFLILLIKKNIPKGYFENLFAFMFQNRIFKPTRDQLLSPILPVGKGEEG